MLMSPVLAQSREVALKLRKEESHKKELQRFEVCNQVKLQESQVKLQENQVNLQENQVPQPC